MPVIEADDQFHLHSYMAAQSFNDADDVRVLASRRHEIDQANGAALSFNFSFENQRLSQVTAARGFNFLFRKKAPVPIFLLAKQRRKACRRIEPRKAQPIDATVATHQRARLRVAEKPVVLDLCSPLCHLLLPPRERLPRRSFAKVGSETSRAGAFRGGGLLNLLFARQFTNTLAR